MDLAHTSYTIFKLGYIYLYRIKFDFVSIESLTILRSFRGVNTVLAEI